MTWFIIQTINPGDAALSPSIQCWGLFCLMRNELKQYDANVNCFEPIRARRYLYNTWWYSSPRLMIQSLFVATAHLSDLPCFDLVTRVGLHWYLKHWKIKVFTLIIKHHAIVSVTETSFKLASMLCPKWWTISCQITHNFVWFAPYD